MPTFRYENTLGRKSGAVICGVGEAGRRSLAGPVLAINNPTAAQQCPQ